MAEACQKTGFGLFCGVGLVYHDHMVHNAVHLPGKNHERRLDFPGMKIIEWLVLFSDTCENQPFKFLGRVEQGGIHSPGKTKGWQGAMVLGIGFPDGLSFFEGPEFFFGKPLGIKGDGGFCFMAFIHIALPLHGKAPLFHGDQENGTQFKLKDICHPFCDNRIELFRIFCSKGSLGTFVDTGKDIHLHIQPGLDTPATLFRKLISADLFL